jgi:hypothetical protein
VEVLEPAFTRVVFCLISVSHPLKLNLCRLEREHLLEPFNFLFSDASLLAYSLPRNLTVKAFVSVVTTYYSIRVSDAAGSKRINFCGN